MFHVESLRVAVESVAACVQSRGQWAPWETGGTKGRGELPAARRPRQRSRLGGAPSSPRMSATEAFSPNLVWVGSYEPGPSLAGVEPHNLDLGRWTVLDLNA